MVANIVKVIEKYKAQLEVRLETEHCIINPLERETLGDIKEDILIRMEDQLA